MRPRREEGYRLQLWLSLASAAVIVAVGLLLQHRRGGSLPLQKDPTSSRL